MEAALLLLPCCAIGMAIVGIIYVCLRKHAGTNILARSKAPLCERESQAHELQDALLQDAQGLILHFQAIAERLREGDRVRKAIEDVLDRADEVLAHERDRMTEQRGAATDLPHTFAMAGSELSLGAPTSFNVTVEGSSKEVARAAGEIICAAGREALANAFRHAGARSVETHIVYGERELLVCVRDDGRGAAPGSLESSALLGQSGVARMRALANALGARLNIWSRAGAGTEVQLRVPSAVAYDRRVSRSASAR